jgi:hypothetical protein
MFTTISRVLVSSVSAVLVAFFKYSTLIVTLLIVVNVG